MSVLIYKYIHTDTHTLCKTESKGDKLRENDRGAGWGLGVGGDADMEFLHCARTACEFGGVVETTESRFPPPPPLLLRLSPLSLLSERLTDHPPVRSLSKYSCLYSFLVRPKSPL